MKILVGVGMFFSVTFPLQDGFAKIILLALCLSVCNMPLYAKLIFF